MVSCSQSLDANGLRDSTLIIVSSDHGGHDTTHGYDVPEDMTIPWIVSGPGVQSLELTSSVQTMDTAATAAYALGLSIPDEWDGIPVTEAFGLPVSIENVWSVREFRHKSQYFGNVEYIKNGEYYDVQHHYNSDAHYR